MNVWLIVAVSVIYLGILFAIAYIGDRRADVGHSIISNGWIYGLSLGVYATTWTYYGSVGRAAETGIGFLPIYLGPTVMAVVWVVLMRKIIRICREQRITSLADFVSSRYGKSEILGQLVTVVAVVGVVPYIALQLKAVSTTFTLLRDDPAATAADPHWLSDSALWIALLLAAFTIVFGTRHLDATERHEGMVSAIAFESVVKLFAFLAVGVYVTFVMFNGFGDIFGRAQAVPELEQLFSFGESQSYVSWAWLIVLSAFAVVLLPRQWQVGVIENVDESHLRTASWLFPLYLLLINIFVLPITVAGLLRFGDGDVIPDNFVLALPMSQGQDALTLLVFLGGLSAATGMVVVETIALSTMVSNSLVLPAVLRHRGTLRGDRNLSGLIMTIRRITIVLVLLLGFAYVRVAGESLTLVSIGLVSFAAVAQFAPAVLGGLYWKGATARGALWGMLAGFGIWAYTLPLPSLSTTGLVSSSFVTDGPFGISWLAPHSLFGVSMPDTVSHSMMWSMLANVALFIGLSLGGKRSPSEHVQASAFVDVFTGTQALAWRGSATTGDLERLLGRFIGTEAARSSFSAYAARTGNDVSHAMPAGAELVHHVESSLAGAVGAVSARVIVSSATNEEPLSVNDVMQVLDETSQVLATSRALERKSMELEAATTELREANLRLEELDRLKDDFISSVTHELRTPLTSIRAFSEILVDNPDLPSEQREEYLRIIVAETERLTRLINQVLDLSKLEAEATDWRIEPIDLPQVVRRAVESTAQLARDRDITVRLTIIDHALVLADEDKLMQVMLNVLGNALKFSPDAGHIEVEITNDGENVQVDIADEGPGIPADNLEAIFDKFHQVGGKDTYRPGGTGLGLPISRQIINHLGGRIWVTSVPSAGATFSFTLPVAHTSSTDPVIGKTS